MPLKRARFKISDYNENRKVNQRNQQRRIRMVSLSLTSMVDMFAILVIFLLVNSSTVSQWIEVGHEIQLPQAKFSDPPPKAATLQISRDGVYGDKEGKTDALLKLSQLQQGSVGPLKFWLQHQPKSAGYVNIVAHDELPFGVIRKLIFTCQEMGFKTVNLAVQPKT